MESMLPAVTPKKRLGRPSRGEVGRRGPVRLGDDADPKPLGLQQAPDDGHAEARVVHIGVAGDDDDVATVPAQAIHLLPGGGQLRGRSQAVGPELAVGEEVGGCVHGAGLGLGQSRHCSPKVTAEFPHANLPLPSWAGPGGCWGDRVRAPQKKTPANRGQESGERPAFGGLEPGQAGKFHESRLTGSAWRWAWAGYGDPSPPAG